MPSLVKEGPEFENRLFHNNGNLTFTDVTDKAGVAAQAMEWAWRSAISIMMADQTFIWQA
jgi:hypothetical protein